MKFRTESGKRVFSKKYNLLWPLSLKSLEIHEHVILEMAFKYSTKFLLAINIKSNSLDFLNSLGAGAGLVKIAETCGNNFKNYGELLLNFQDNKKFLKNLLLQQKK